MNTLDSQPIRYEVLVIEYNYSGGETRRELPHCSGSRAKSRAISEARCEAELSTVRKVIVRQLGGKMRGLEVFRYENPEAVRPAPHTGPSVADRLMDELRAMRPGFYT
jgi:hypothetical protein